MTHAKCCSFVCIHFHFRVSIDKPTIVKIWVKHIDYTNNRPCVWACAWMRYVNMKVEYQLANKTCTNYKSHSHSNWNYIAFNEITMKTWMERERECTTKKSSNSQQRWNKVKFWSEIHTEIFAIIHRINTNTIYIETWFVLMLVFADWHVYSMIFWHPLKHSTCNLIH